MRLSGLAGLLIALLIVGILVKKQLVGVAAPLPPAGTAPTGDARAQGQQVQQQIKQSLDAAMQARPVPDDN